MIEIKKSQDLLKFSATIILIFILIGMMYMIAKQQGDINRNAQIRIDQDNVIREQLETIVLASATHDEFIEFIREGQRFTYQDGQALFYLINNCEGEEKTHEGLVESYDGIDTQFRKWLFEQRQCIK